MESKARAIQDTLVKKRTKGGDTSSKATRLVQHMKVVNNVTPGHNTQSLGMIEVIHDDTPAPPAPPTRRVLLNAARLTAHLDPLRNRAGLTGGNLSSRQRSFMTQSLGHFDFKKERNIIENDFPEITVASLTEPSAPNSWIDNAAQPLLTRAAAPANINEVSQVLALIRVNGMHIKIVNGDQVEAVILNNPVITPPTAIDWAGTNENDKKTQMAGRLQYLYQKGYILLERRLTSEPENNTHTLIGFVSGLNLNGLGGAPGNVEDFLNDVTLNDSQVQVLDDDAYVSVVDGNDGTDFWIGANEDARRQKLFKKLCLLLNSRTIRKRIDHGLVTMTNPNTDATLGALFNARPGTAAQTLAMVRALRFDGQSLTILDEGVVETSIHDDTAGTSIWEAGISLNDKRTRLIAKLNTLLEAGNISIPYVSTRHLTMGNNVLTRINEDPAGDLNIATAANRNNLSALLQASNIYPMQSIDPPMVLPVLRRPVNDVIRDMNTFLEDYNQTLTTVGAATYAVLNNIADVQALPLNIQNTFAIMLARFYHDNVDFYRFDVKSVPQYNTFLEDRFHLLHDNHERFGDVMYNILTNAGTFVTNHNRSLLSQARLLFDHCGPAASRPEFTSLINDLTNADTRTDELQDTRITNNLQQVAGFISKAEMFLMDENDRLEALLDEAQAVFDLDTLGQDNDALKHEMKALVKMIVKKLAPEYELLEKDEDDDEDKADKEPLPQYYIEYRIRRQALMRKFVQLMQKYLAAEQ